MSFSAIPTPNSANQSIVHMHVFADGSTFTGAQYDAYSAGFSGVVDDLSHVLPRAMFPSEYAEGMTFRRVVEGNCECNAADKRAADEIAEDEEAESDDDEVSNCGQCGCEKECFERGRSCHSCRCKEQNICTTCDRHVDVEQLWSDNENYLDGPCRACVLPWPAGPCLGCSDFNDLEDGYCNSCAYLKKELSELMTERDARKKAKTHHPIIIVCSDCLAMNEIECIC